MRSENAELTRAFEDFVRKNFGLFPFVGVWSELLLGEFSDGLTKLVVLFAEGIGHRCILGLAVFRL
jgi:hypothetical protein